MHTHTCQPPRLASHPYTAYIAPNHPKPRPRETVPPRRRPALFILFLGPARRVTLLPATSASTTPFPDVSLHITSLHLACVRCRRHSLDGPHLLLPPPPAQNLRIAVQDVNSHDSERSTDPTRTRLFCCFFARFPPPQGPFHLSCPTAAPVRLLPLVVARSGLSSVRMRVGCRLSTIVCTQLIIVAPRQLPLLLTDCPTDAEGGTHPSSRMQANRSRYCSFYKCVTDACESISPIRCLSPSSHRSLALQIFVRLGR